MVVGTTSRTKPSAAAQPVFFPPLCLPAEPADTANIGENPVPPAAEKSWQSARAGLCKRSLRLEIQEVIHGERGCKYGKRKKIKT